MRKKTGKKPGEEQSKAGQMQFPFRGLARQALWDTVILSGFGFVQDELEAERTALCGARYAHQEHWQAVRAGHVASSLVLGGRRVEIQRTRARSAESSYGLSRRVLMASHRLAPLLGSEQRGDLNRADRRLLAKRGL